MVSPNAFFLEVYSSKGDASFGGVRNWLDRIVQDYRTRGSQNYVETLAITISARMENNIAILNTEQLEFIKDYLPRFDYLFIGGPPNKAVVGPSPDVTKQFHRSAFVNASKDAASLFIQWLKSNHISIPIHWYIDWETDITSFGDQLNGANYANGFKDLFSRYTTELTNISLNSGLNQPEFLWSPYTSTLFSNPGEVTNLRDLLVSVPKLSWLHVQDGIGVKSVVTPDGNITYHRHAEDVINWYHNILAPASGSVKSNRINMECFLIGSGGNEMPPADPMELDERQSKYIQANIPIGVSFELRYFIGSKYWTAVPRVIGQHFHDAEQAIKNAGLVPIFEGSTSTFQKVIKQVPPASHWDGHQLDWAPKGSNVTMTMEQLTMVEVPSVVGSTAHLARQALTPLGLIPVFHGHQGNNKVQSQNPEGGDTVPKHTKVYCEMEQN